MIPNPKTYSKKTKKQTVHLFYKTQTICAKLFLRIFTITVMCYMALNFLYYPKAIINTKVKDEFRVSTGEVRYTKNTPTSSVRKYTGNPVRSLTFFCYLVSPPSEASTHTGKQLNTCLSSSSATIQVFTDIGIPII